MKKKYKVVRFLFPANKSVVKEGLTKDKANALATQWNLETDSYETYDIEEMEIDARVEELNKKLNKIKNV